MVSSSLFFSGVPSSSCFPFALMWDLNGLQGNLWSSAWSCCLSFSGQSSPSPLLSPEHLHPVHSPVADYLFYKTLKGLPNGEEWFLCILGIVIMYQFKQQSCVLLKFHILSC